MLQNAENCGRLKGTKIRNAAPLSRRSIHLFFFRASELWQLEGKEHILFLRK